MTEKHLKKLEAVSLKWEEFSKKKNTEDVLSDKASILASIMCYQLSHATNTMRNILSESGVEIEDKRCWSVYYDFLLFMLHTEEKN